MATVNFLYRSTKSSAHLSLRLLFRSYDKDFVIAGNTKLRVSREYWTKHHKQKRPKDILISNEQTRINNEINKLSNYILEAFKDANALLVNKVWLQQRIDMYYCPAVIQNVIPTTICEYIDYYINYRKHDLKPDLIKKIKVTKHKLQRFEEYRNKYVYIKDVNEALKNEFVDYCKAEHYGQNTIQRDLVAIKTFCKHARFLGLETHPQLDGLKLDKQRTDNIYLSFIELEQIEMIPDEKLSDTLNHAKDWLIISCYTGQRISDFMRFNDKQIRVEKGKKLIEFTQKKTNKLMTIPLHPKVCEILDKRQGKFPNPLPDQKYNDLIKAVCALANIKAKVNGGKKSETFKNSKMYRKQVREYEKWELVSSHIGRRSFSTNFYGKIPTTLLISATGHSSEVMFLKYIGKSNKDLAMELGNYF